MHKYPGLLIAALLISLIGCGGGGGGNNFLTPPPPTFSFSLSSSSLKIFPSGQPGSITANITRNGSTGSMNASVSGLPAGATVQVSGFASTSAGTVTISPGSAAAGTYNASVAVSDGQTSVTQALTLTIGVNASVDTATTGTLNMFMSTSFQPAEWDYTVFQAFPNATTPLTSMGPQHIRIQAVSQAVPQRTASTWNFTMLDAIMNPVFSSADHSPEFQIAVAPPFMNDSNGHLLPANFQAFADYSAQLVRYYNTGGFTATDGTHASTAGYPITYWGIFNEPNINGLSPTQYTDLYNLVVPEIQSVDQNSKFVAVELSDWGNQNTTYIPPFVSGVTAQVDAMATHFYSTCNQKDSDAQLFSTIPDFANRVSYLYSQMQANPALVNVPVWITENNVNADYSNNGMSACNPGTAFVTDTRGSSPYFAAWRPYMFSRAGKAGAKALYTWVFLGDPQYGEMNDQTGKPRLSYWVDYWLTHYFPAPPGAELLHYTSSDDANVEILPAKNADGSVVVMIANHAVASAADNNGRGAPRSISIDISQLGTFTNAKLLTIDANTDAVNGPQEAATSVASTMEVDFTGYGVAFLTLK